MIDARLIRFSVPPWCKADESPVMPDGSQAEPEIRRHYLHQCGCPELHLLRTTTERTDAKCGHPAFVATAGAPRKIFAKKTERYTRGTYREACAGSEEGVVYQTIPAAESAIEVSKTFEREETAAGVVYHCVSDSTDVSPTTPPTPPCDPPAARRKTEDFVHDWVQNNDGSCTSNSQTYETEIVSPLGGSSTPSPAESQTLPDTTETLQYYALDKITWTHTAAYQKITKTPEFWNPTGCGEQVMTMSSSAETIPVEATPNELDEQTITRKAELADPIDDYTLIGLRFNRDLALNATAYNGVQDDEGQKVSRAVQYCFVIEKLLVEVEYRLRVVIKRRTREWSDEGIVYGDWEAAGEEQIDFVAERRTEVIGGQWLPEDSVPSFTDAEIEWDIPEDADDFATVRDAETHNAEEATVRPELVLGDDTPGYEYAIHEVVVFPLAGTHIHEGEEEA